MTAAAGGIRLAPGLGGRGSLLRYALADASRVTVSLLDMQGRERARRVEGWQSAGSHVMDLSKERLSPGWYLMRFEAAPAAAKAGRASLREEAPVFLGR
jgi:hypothetical protein